MTFTQLSLLAADSGFDSAPEKSIGWASGIFTFLLCVAVGLLLWSFARNARRARQPWEGEHDGGVDIEPRTSDDATGVAEADREADRAEPPTS